MFCLLLVLVIVCESNGEMVLFLFSSSRRKSVENFVSIRGRRRSIMKLMFSVGVCLLFLLMCFVCYLVILYELICL